MGGCTNAAHRDKPKSGIRSLHAKSIPKVTDGLKWTGQAISIPLPRFPRRLPLQRQRILRGPPLQTAHQQTWVSGRAGCIQRRSAHDWAMRYERTENSPEADLVVRTGDINNLGFGWPKNYDPFSGKSTPAHPFPWPPKPGEPDGTDRILLGSAVTKSDFAEHPFAGEGYTSTILRPCIDPLDASSCKPRQDSMPQPIVIPVGALPAKIDAVLFQIFVDDFQAPSFHSHFQASLNGTRIPSLEQVLNALEQTGPIGKLIRSICCRSISRC